MIVPVVESRSLGLKLRIMEIQF